MESKIVTKPTFEEINGKQQLPSLEETPLESLTEEEKAKIYNMLLASKFLKTL